MKNKGRGKREEGRGVSEEEIQEAATELPALLGCPQHMPTHLPGGFDGTEPAPKKRSEVEKLNEMLFERLGEIVRKCCAMRVECDPEHVDYDPAETNLKLFGAFSELRQMCDFYKPREKPVDPTAQEMERGKGRLFKYKHTSSCRGTYIYDRVVINGAHLHADLHFDNGGLEQHGSVYVGDSPRAFCFVTFNTSGATKCDYAMRGLLAGIAKRLVYHHKNLIKRKAKWAAAKTNS